MTLIEIMVVVAIIGLLMGSVGVYAWQRFKHARVTTARLDISNLQQALTQYRLETNDDCPAELNDLFRKKFVKKPPKDPWGKEFMYKCPGEHDTEGADISSRGPDRQEGTDDDINSWDEDGAAKAEE
jgi:general secretion pathway protein G